MVSVSACVSGVVCVLTEISVGCWRPATATAAGGASSQHQRKTLKEGRKETERRKGGWSDGWIGGEMGEGDSDFRFFFRFAASRGAHSQPNERTMQGEEGKERRNTPILSPFVSDASLCLSVLCRCVWFVFFFFLCTFGGWFELCLLRQRQKARQRKHKASFWADFGFRLATIEKEGRKEEGTKQKVKTVKEIYEKMRNGDLNRYTLLDHPFEPRIRNDCDAIYLEF